MEFLLEIRRLNAMPWRKLVDLRNLRVALTPEELVRIGAGIRAVNFSSKVGALAVVMPLSEPERVMRLLGFLAAADRPMLLTDSLEEAQRWIASPPDIGAR